MTPKNREKEKKMEKGRGRVILVGAGPGDPSLITVRGLEAIRRADVIVHDYLANPLLLDEAPENCERVYAGKRGSDHTIEQDEMNLLLLDRARRGRLVVRLKGGDPNIFGRGSEEMDFLGERGIEVEVVPGVPAALGAAAYAGIPLTDRRRASCVTFVTGHEDPSKPESSIRWEHLAKTGGTLVFYMGVKNLPEIARRLLDHGLHDETPVTIVEKATSPSQRTVSGVLATIADSAKKAGIHPPALIIAGGVNELRRDPGWFENRPLFGKTLVVTRSRPQASVLLEGLRELGAEALEMPAIAIRPPEDRLSADAAAERLDGYDWVIFTSVNGVDFFMESVRAAGLDARGFAGVKIAAIGPATSERLARFGLIADYQPPKYIAEAIFEGLAGREDLHGKRILLPRADIARKALPDLLKGAGAEVDEIAIYRTVRGDFDADLLRRKIVDDEIDAVTFTSSSTARFFVEGLGREFVSGNRAKIRGVSIGPVTSETMRSLGIEPAAEACVHTIDGLIETIRDFFAGAGTGARPSK